MKLSKWAQKQGISYTTAWRWFKAGKLPSKSYKTETGTIIVEDAVETNTQNVVIYCRVSSHDKKADLDRQVERCLNYTISKGYQVSKIYKETASGMNDDRKEFWKMIDTNPTNIIVENKDRLTRFGFNYIDRLMKKLNCSVEVITPLLDDETDLIKDMIAIVTSFCCRLYGARRGQHKRAKIKEILDDKND